MRYQPFSYTTDRLRGKKSLCGEMAKDFVHGLVQTGRQHNAASIWALRSTWAVRSTRRFVVPEMGDLAKRLVRMYF
jgi:hypothetical protein